jgi:hypothetical protein
MHPTRADAPLTTTHPTQPTPICITTHPRQPPLVSRRKSPRRARTATSNGRANAPPTTTRGAQKPPTMAHASHQAATTALVTRSVMPITRQNAGASEQPLVMAHQRLRPQSQSRAMTTTTTWGAHSAPHHLSLLGYTWASRRSARCGFGTRVLHALAVAIAITHGNTLTTRGALCAPHLCLSWATPWRRAEARDAGSVLACPQPTTTVIAPRHHMPRGWNGATTQSTTDGATRESTTPRR